MKIQTDALFYNSNRNFIRSSALKSYDTCSWLYYCQYFLNIPSTDNQGSKQGNVCHTFLECMIEDRRKPLFKEITKNGTTRKSPSAYRLIRKLILRNNLPDSEEIYDNVDRMILVGLKTDFYVRGAKRVGKEYRFKIENENPKYAIYGTMDKISLKGEYCLIDDYKSSKMKYSGDDKEAGIQALFYSLACKKLYPNHKPKVRFIFLQFPDDPIQEVEFSEETLAGFEHYLESIQVKTNAFTIADAKERFAADITPTGNEFKGKLVCGFANKPGQLKKNGQLMWHCPYKFGFKYFALLNNANQVIATNKENVFEPKADEWVEEMTYEGCPKFIDPLKGVEKKTVFKDPLDDF